MSGSLLKEFLLLYRAKFGESYPVAWGKHGSILKRLVQSYTPETIRRFFDLLLDDTDDFVKKAGHRLEILSSQIPRYLSKMKEESKAGDASADFDRIKDLLT